MSLNILCFVSLLVSIFSAVLCVPQIPSQTFNDSPDDDGSSTNAENYAFLATPSNVAFDPGTGFQDNSKIVALQSNGLETMHLTDSALVDAAPSGSDPGRATINNIFDEAYKDDNFDAVDAKLSTANTFLLAQAQKPPDNPSTTPGETTVDNPDQGIEETPSEEAAGARADPKPKTRHQKTPGLFNEGARARDGYDDSKCPAGSRWACCINKWGSKGGWLCTWLTDNSVCKVIACCFPGSRGMPDEYCPDMPPMRKAANALGYLRDSLGDFFEPVFGPAGGGGGAGAAGIGGAAGASSYKP